MRALLDAWYSHLPEHARRNIWPRFTRPRRADHLGAFFELYQHELAINGGYDEVDFDVGQEDPTHLRPDLLLRTGCARCWVEATVSQGDDVVDPRSRARADQFRDAIERIRSRQFFLTVELQRVGADSPSRKDVVAPIDAWLDSLDPDVEIRRAAAGDPPTRKTFSPKGWKFTIEAIGRPASERGRGGAGVLSWIEGLEGHTRRFVGEKTIEVEGPRPLNDHELLTSTLISKAKHGYELDDIPFVVAVMCAGTFVEDRDIAQALLGPIRYAFDPGLAASTGRMNLGASGRRVGAGDTRECPR